MSTMSTTARAVPKSAFLKLAITESKLFLREPAGIMSGLILPLALLIIFGSLPFGQQPSKDFGGLRFVDVYVPILIGFTLAMLALNALPPALATYREKGILRRLSTTPVPPSRVLAVQLAINLVIAVITTALIIGVGRFAFNVALPQQAIGFVLAFGLAAVALLGLGLFIAAVAPNGRIANGVGAILTFPMIFLAGVWLPREAMPDVLHRISDFSPLGAAVQALQDSMQGHWPQPLHLGVMAVYAIVFAMAAVRLFRWK